MFDFRLSRSFSVIYKHRERLKRFNNIELLIYYVLVVCGWLALANDTSSV